MCRHRSVITIATQIDIDASPDQVWAVLVDYPAYAEWNPYIVAVTGRDGDAEIMVHAVMRPGAPPTVQTIAVIAAQFPELRWAGGLPDRSRFSGDHRFRVAAAPTGTRFSHVEHFSGSEAAAILAQHGELIRGNFERFNAAIKQRCEA